jgi:hypothetical protein
MQGDPHVRFDEQGVETGRLVSPTGKPQIPRHLLTLLSPTGLLGRLSTNSSHS